MAIIAPEKLIGDAGILDSGSTINRITVHIKAPYIIPVKNLNFKIPGNFQETKKKKIVKRRAMI